MMEVIKIEMLFPRLTFDVYRRNLQIHVVSLSHSGRFIPTLELVNHVSMNYYGRNIRQGIT